MIATPGDFRKSGRLMAVSRPTRVARSRVFSGGGSGLCPG